jgi:hypothetical protein
MLQLTCAVEQARFAGPLEEMPEYSLESQCSDLERFLRILHESLRWQYSTNIRDREFRTLPNL